jgi:hypothetical protein
MLLTLLLCLPALALAQPAETGSTPPPSCSDPAYRQFDFWIGDWNVTANDQPAGTNSIQPVHNGCALEENWQGAGAGGVSGSSLNIYDRANDRWHQTWVDGNGTLLQLDGGLVDGAMVLRGTRPAEDGNGITTHRITWTPNADGSVRQLWEASRDGQTWSVLFDGLYTRAAGDE